MVTLTAKSGTGGLPQLFLQPMQEMLEIQSGKVLIFIAPMSVLRHQKGFEQFHGLATVKYVQQARSRARSSAAPRQAAGSHPKPHETSLVSRVSES